jgi:Ca-activated chloride channel family protein
MNGTSESRFGRSGTAQRVSTTPLRPVPFAATEGMSGWRLAVPGRRPLATPAVVDGRLFVGGGFGSHEFYALDAASGEPLWGLRVSDDGPSAAVVSGGFVVFNTESCTLFVVDAGTGEHVWSRWLGDPLMAQPAVHENVVFMAYPGRGGHRLGAFGLGDGEPLWTVPIAGDVISAPVVAGDVVWFTTFDGTVYRLRRADGACIWSRGMRATSAPWIRGDEVHVSQRAPGADGVPREGFTRMRDTGEVLSEMSAARRAAYLDPRTQRSTRYEEKSTVSDAAVGFGAGAPASAKSHAAAANVGHGRVRSLWEYQGSRPTVIDERSYSSHGTSLRAIHAATGEPCWDRPLPGDARALGGHLGTPPAHAAGKVVVGTATGEVLACDAGDGRVLLRAVVGQELRFQPALARGRIHVGSASGTLFTIETGDPTFDGWTMWGGGPCHNGV